MKPIFLNGIFTLPFIVLLCNFTIGQTQFPGIVQTWRGESVSFSNVLFLQAKDSSLVKGMITSQSGNYQLENVKEGRYLFITSLIGYTIACSPPFVFIANQVTFYKLLLVENYIDSC